MSENVIEIKPEIIQRDNRAEAENLVKEKTGELISFMDGLKVESGNIDGNCVLGSMLCFMNREDLQAVINKVFERNWDYVCTGYGENFKVKKREHLTPEEIERGDYQTILERTLRGRTRAHRNLIPVCFMRTLMALNRLGNKDIKEWKVDGDIETFTNNELRISHGQQDVVDFFSQLNGKKKGVFYSCEDGLIHTQDGNSFRALDLCFCDQRSNKVYDYTGVMRNMLENYLQSMYFGEKSEDASICVRELEKKFKSNFDDVEKIKYQRYWDGFYFNIDSYIKNLLSEVRFNEELKSKFADNLHGYIMNDVWDISDVEYDKFIKAKGLKRQDIYNLWQQIIEPLKQFLETKDENGIKLLDRMVSCRLKYVHELTAEERLKHFSSIGQNICFVISTGNHVQAFGVPKKFKSKMTNNGICKDMTNWDEVVKCLSDKNKKQRCIYILNLFRDNQISKEMLVKIVELDDKQYNRIENFADTMQNNKCPNKIISFVVGRILQGPKQRERYVELKSERWNDFLVESIKKENISEAKNELNDLYKMANENDESFDNVLQYYMGIDGQARKQLINLAKVCQKQNKGGYYIASVVQEFADIVIELESSTTFQKIVGHNKVNYFDKDLTGLLEFVVNQNSLSVDDKKELINRVMKVKFLSTYLGQKWDNNEIKEMVTKATSNETEFGDLIAMLNAKVTGLKKLAKQKTENNITSDSIANTNLDQNARTLQEQLVKANGNGVCAEQIVVNANQITNDKNINQTSKLSVPKLSFALASVFGIVAIGIFALANLLTLGFVSLGLGVISAFVGGCFSYKEYKNNAIGNKNVNPNNSDKNLSEGNIETIPERESLKDRKERVLNENQEIDAACKQESRSDDNYEIS